MDEIPVLIAGGGPVGLTLALDLGSRGVPCLVVEETQRKLAIPRCNAVSARSMEHFRRLGIAHRIRGAGLPPDYPGNVSYRTRINGEELFRIAIPSVQSMSDESAVNTFAGLTCEPPHRIAQMFFEPILREEVLRSPNIEYREHTRLESFRQTPDGVEAVTRSTITGQPALVRADYLVGCDGGKSAVRHQLGVRLTGDDVVCRAVSTYIYTSAFDDFNRPRNWMIWSVNPDALFVSLAIDGRGRWLVHAFFPADSDTESLDPERLITQAFGERIAFELLGVERWTPRRLVAEGYGAGRVFIAGDAAHLWIPFAGFGMNVGIGDAAELAWMLSAVRAGWAGTKLLENYETERHPVAEGVSSFVTRVAEALLALVHLPQVADEAGVGESDRRDRLRTLIESADQGQYRPLGLNFGYHYCDSPLIVADGPPPPFTIASYCPTTTPGARLPHLVLADGTPIYDHLGSDFTLLRVGVEPPDSVGLLRAAAERKMPVKVIDVTEEDAVTCYGKGLILVRPDQHIAWRGQSIPSDTQRLIDTVRGCYS